MSILLILFAVLVIYAISTYNGLIRSKVKTEESFSGIDVALSKRYNVLVNLQETVKGAAAYEEGVFAKITECRNSMGMKEKQALASEYDRVQTKLLAIAENYPQLTAGQNFLNLQEAIVDCEEHLQAARRFHNANVADYNIKIDSFPTNLIAQMMGLEKAEFFESENRDSVWIHF